MARPRKRGGRTRPNERQYGHDISLDFGGSSGRLSAGDEILRETRSTPSTPTTAASSQRKPRVARNLESALGGDDSGLLPYRPTNTINPKRPRTLAAGYDAENQTLFVRFRDGAGYEYDNVTRDQWRTFKNTPSPGRYINRELNHHPYRPADW